jgi:hypothetical protein
MINFRLQASAPMRRIRNRPPSECRRRLSAACKGLAWLLVAMFASGQTPVAEIRHAAAAADVGEAKRTAESPIHYAGITYRSDNRRDPFLNPISMKKKSSVPVDEEADRGLAPPGIGGTYIAKAILKGISIQDANRVAVVRGADKRTYFLREGDRLFDGYLKMIDTDSVTLVRETKMKSGKVVTQDVTLRLRNP